VVVKKRKMDGNISVAHTLFNCVTFVTVALEHDGHANVSEETKIIFGIKEITLNSLPLCSHSHRIATTTTSAEITLTLF